MTAAKKLQSIDGESIAAAPKPLRHRKIDNHGAHEEVHDEGEPWLLSYADMVTLLMCFFILFFSLDKTKGGISDPERLKTKLESLIALEVASNSKSRSQGAAGKDKSSVRVKKLVYEDLKKVAKDLKIVFSLSNPDPGTVEITFLNINFFDSGKATITPAGMTAISKITPRLSSLDRRTTVEVQGHTDGDLMKSGGFPSNWELSTARASAVARLLISKGVNAQGLMVSGFGEHKPLMPEKDAAGIESALAKKMNRRVTILVHMPRDEDDEPTPAIKAKGSKGATPDAPP